NDHGKKSECEISTPVKGFASAFGCYSTDNRNTYRCLSGGKELPCTIGSDEFRKPTTNISALNKIVPHTTNLTVPDMRAASQADGQTSLQMFITLGILGCLAIVSVIGLTLVRRARNRTAFQQLESKLGMRSSLYLLTKSESAFSLAKPLSTTYISKASAYTVATMYDPTLSDELVIRHGDKVLVYEEYDDGWVKGANLTRGGATGIFPK
ncbi:hypothetical protein L0F63_003311, partial [Massospora cicadina]